MKAERFEATPEFQHFREAMRGILSVPKTRLDALMKKERISKKRSPAKKKPRQSKKDQPH
jgi:hypothetical protein